MRACSLHFLQNGQCINVGRYILHSALMTLSAWRFGVSDRHTRMITVYATSSVPTSLQPGSDEYAPSALCSYRAPGPLEGRHGDVQKGSLWGFL